MTAGIGGAEREEENRESPGVELASVLPRVLVVSRRTVRKNKFVDFVGEYHLDLVVRYGAVPVIVPRVSGLSSLLDSFEPIHGVLLCEGEDIDPTLYESDLSSLSYEEKERIKQSHSSDTKIDKAKDSIELQLARRCLERNIPYLGICRGSQVLNVACGGSLYQDIETELSGKVGVSVLHINYDNYDGHRHPVKVMEGTPLEEWFKNSLEHAPNKLELVVNSYHHQGVKRLAARFQPMAFAPDGLVEAFYDPDTYHPDEGKFIVGLQFHPERMRHEQDVAESEPSSESIFDYPGCPRAYQEFVKAVVAYQRLLTSRTGKVAPTLDQEKVEKQRQQLERSFSIAKHLYAEQEHLRKCASHGDSQGLATLQKVQAQSELDLELGARFLQSNTVLSTLQVKRLHQMGATVRNSSLFLEKLQMNERKENEARKMMQGMQVDELQDFVDFYRMMVDVGTGVLHEKRSLKNIL